MGDSAQTLFGPGAAGNPLAHYAPPDRAADLYHAADPATAQIWRKFAAGAVAQADGDLASLQSYVDRQAQDMGIAYRMAGDDEERAWPLNPMPLILSADEWQGIEAGLAQRAELLEKLIADIYGPQHLVRGGHLPAAVIAGSAHFARRMVGTSPPGGHHLHVCAFDLARGPDGEWRVLMDRTRLPIGIGYALENRTALMRATGGMAGRLGARRHDAFFDALRSGLTADCARTDPRIALLTPGRFNQAYPEQAYLARHLGFSLVEGRDLAVRDGLLYVRTIAGLKRIDALWRWINTRDIDPLHFDARSRIGVSNLIAACENDLVLANWPGVGVIETRAMPAFLPRIAQELLGEPLAMPNMATWWCGGTAERDYALANLDQLVLSSAFREDVTGLPDGRTRAGAGLSAEERQQFADAMARRPMDYVAQEIVHLSTTPVIEGQGFDARSFTLRAFLARDADGRWVAMPGGFARVSQSGNLRTSLMGFGDHSVDVWVTDPKPPAELEPAIVRAPAVRREDGLLGSQAADNLFWLGRYGERLNHTARVIRSLVAQYASVDAPRRSPSTTTRLSNLLRLTSAVPPQSRRWQPSRLALVALSEKARPGSVRHLAGRAHDLAQLLRDRLTRDIWRILQRPFPLVDDGSADELIDACDTLVERYAAFVGLAGEGLSHSAVWRFLDLGMALERASLIMQAARTLMPCTASAQDLSALLDLCDCLGIYRSRYLAMPTLAPALDMALLDPAHPRGFAYQLVRINGHLDALPPLREDGLPERATVLARSLRAQVEGTAADALTPAVFDDWLAQLGRLSDAVSRSYFLQQETGDRSPTSLIVA